MNKFCYVVSFRERSSVTVLMLQLVLTAFEYPEGSWDVDGEKFKNSRGAGHEGAVKEFAICMVPLLPLCLPWHQCGCQCFFGVFLGIDICVLGLCTHQTEVYLGFAPYVVCYFTCFFLL